MKNLIHLQKNVVVFSFHLQNVNIIIFFCNLCKIKTGFHLQLAVQRYEENETKSAHCINNNHITACFSLPVHFKKKLHVRVRVRLRK